VETLVAFCFQRHPDDDGRNIARPQSAAELIGTHGLLQFQHQLRAALIHTTSHRPHYTGMFHPTNMQFCMELQIVVKTMGVIAGASCSSAQQCQPQPALTMLLLRTGTSVGWAIRPLDVTMIHTIPNCCGNSMIHISTCRLL